MSKKEQTEELIKATAKKLFFVQGKFDATTQEIADAAGVNRTLINYYFRSVENLLRVIFDEATAKEREKGRLIHKKDMTVKEKITAFVEQSLEQNLKYPYLETYIVSQMNKGICINEDLDMSTIDLFNTLILEEMEKGNIEKVEPIQFTLNMISLLSFPNAARPLLMDNLKIDEIEFDRILAERKNIILNILFKK